jgi:peptidoglycan hydrolase-like protein with peptidoglycan-binding domain
MVKRTIVLLTIFTLAGMAVVMGQHAEAWEQRVYLDKKNNYFSLIPPAGWTRRDYEDTRSKVSWHEIIDSRVLLRVIAREAEPAENYQELKNRTSQTAAQWAARGVSLKQSEISFGETRAILLEGNVAEVGTTRLLFFLMGGIHFNCQYAAPTRPLYEKHLAQAMGTLETIQLLPGRGKEATKQKAQELSWYKRYAYLLEKIGEPESSRALATKGLQKFPDDQELQARAKMDLGAARPPSLQQPHNREEILQAQKRLQALGFNPGPIDGVMGRQTQDVLRQFQRTSGLPVNGVLDEATLKALQVSSSETSKSSLDVPASNHVSVRFDGLYRAMKDSGATFLHFLEDGRVYLASVGGSAEHVALVATAKKVAQWIDDENRKSKAFNKGTYKIRGGSITLSITGYLNGRPDVYVDYEGTIQGDTLILNSHSHTTGHKGQEIYKFVTMSGQ